MAAPRRIFLDLDGVLTDFVAAALRLHGREDALETWPPGEWHMHTVIGVTSSAFWQVIDRQGAEFWAGLEPYPWAFSLVDELRRIAPVTIASSPSLDPGSLDGKLRWLQKHFGRSFRDFLIGPPKHLLARHDAVLIDDSDRNIADFRAHGGRGVLFPQPWNSNHARCADRITHVVETTTGLVDGDPPRK